MIQWIRSMNRHDKYHIPLGARKDMAWWARYLNEFNGKAILWLVKEPGVDTVIATDACPSGLGGTAEQEYFHLTFPPHMRKKNIAHLEMWALLVALKLWGRKCTGKYFWVHVDNEAVAYIVNSGSSRDEYLQDCLTELAMITAKHQFIIKAKHIMGTHNRIPDWLSRWRLSGYRKKFHDFARNKSMKRIVATQTLLQFEHSW